eukprot:c17355_g2_i1.p1 GENE.c17355_g2_i1~~c17355_g2_i1.p1  ORF type:complete len:518 (+),score=78.63 c17355_g2_i1:231-1784(+)
MSSGAPPRAAKKKKGGCCGNGGGAVEPAPDTSPSVEVAGGAEAGASGTAEAAPSVRRNRTSQVASGGGASPKPSAAGVGSLSPPPSGGHLGFPPSSGRPARSNRGDDDWWRGRTIGSRESSLKSLYQQVSNRPVVSNSDVGTSNRLQLAASATTGIDSSYKGASVETSERSSDLNFEELSQARFISRVYAHVNDDMADAFFDTTQEPMDWGPFSLYNIRRDKLLGQGAYGEVFLATNAANADVVVKMIKASAETLIKIQKEIMMLRRVQGGPHIIKFIGMVAEPGEESRGLVFEFLHNPNYKESFRRMSDLDARWYLFRILEALDYTHSLGIMHRDIKGGNVLYDPKTKQVRLIDWGFAEFYRANRAQTSWPGTRPYKSPELFLHYPNYDFSVDVWAFACLMASLIFRRTLFRSDDNFHQMELIGRLLGTADYTRYLRKYAALLTPVDAKKYRLIGDRNTARVGLMSFASPKAPLATQDAISVVDSVLQWDHEKRPTARDLMAHTYFDVVRNFRGKR